MEIPRIPSLSQLHKLEDLVGNSLTNAIDALSIVTPAGSSFNDQDNSSPLMHLKDHPPPMPPHFVPFTMDGNVVVQTEILDEKEPLASQPPAIPTASSIKPHSSVGNTAQRSIPSSSLGRDKIVLAQSAFPTMLSHDTELPVSSSSITLETSSRQSPPAFPSPSALPVATSPAPPENGSKDQTIPPALSFLWNSQQQSYQQSPVGSSEEAKQMPRALGASLCDREMQPGEGGTLYSSIWTQLLQFAQDQTSRALILLNVGRNVSSDAVCSACLEYGSLKYLETEFRTSFGVVFVAFQDLRAASEAIQHIGKVLTELADKLPMKDTTGDSRDLPVDSKVSHHFRGIIYTFMVRHLASDDYRPAFMKNMVLNFCFLISFLIEKSDPFLTKYL